MPNDFDSLPVAVVGGGPIGLAAAAHLIERGIPVRVYEAGAAVGATIAEWAHVRTFSPWRYNVDGAAHADTRAARLGDARGRATSRPAEKFCAITCCRWRTRRRWPRSSRPARRSRASAGTASTR